MAIKSNWGVGGAYHATIIDVSEHLGSPSPFATKDRVRIILDVDRLLSRVRDKDPGTYKIGMAMECLAKNRCVGFNYADAHGTTTSRVVEPVEIQFKNNSLYLLAWCLKREAFRTFAIYGMDSVHETDEPIRERDA